MACCDGHQVQNNKKYLQLLLAKTIKFYSLLNVALKERNSKNLISCFEFR